MYDHLVKPSPLKYNAIDFSQVNVSEILPALKHSIKVAMERIERIKNQTSVNFNSIIRELELASDEVDRISHIYFGLHSADCSDEWESISEDVSNVLTNFSNDITLDTQLFEKIKMCYEKSSAENLKAEEKKVLEDYYKEFVRNGALLSDVDKNVLRDIDQKLATLSLEFSKNSLKATNMYELIISDKSRLAGIPDNALEEAQAKARAKDKAGWLFTIDYPTFNAVLTNATDRKLREELWRAYQSKCTTGEFENNSNIKKIVELRYERAKLLGYKTHADFVLEERMALHPEKVMEFLLELKDRALPFAKKEIAQLQELARQDGIEQVMHWDVFYYREKLKEKLLNFNDELLRPYFKLENVIDGVFKIASQLYQLNFVENNEMPKYHNDVKTFEVYDTQTNDFVGLFYADFFPRKTKRSGAWMMNWQDQGLQFGEVKRPHVGIVCNFTKPTESTPSLLTLDEVKTLFHEFGHALHGLLSRCEYTKLSGTSVLWDFVELPSQIMENWSTQRECLDLYARHYQTNEVMPQELVQKITESQTFFEGYATVRQLTFALLDMAYHWNQNPKEIQDIEKFEKEVTKELQILPTVSGVYGSAAFSHIFAGGYSAGYYSYKWAEVLDADAFAYFEEVGIFDQTVAQKFKQYILSAGGTQHPMELYKQFRGSEPSLDALMKRSGFVS
jgi:peptidyl-dipeptidase Dcp